MILGEKIFIDCGGNDGSSVRFFRQKYDPGEDYKIYTFEPHPRFVERYIGFKNHELIRKAVWIDSGIYPFYLDNEDYDGSSLIKSKTTGQLDANNPLFVGTVDLHDWIVKTLSREDYIFLKMDIEGAEYQVLNRLIDEGSIEYLNSTSLEWHWKKLAGFNRNTHDRLVAKLKKLNLNTEHDVARHLFVQKEHYIKRQR